MNEKSEVAYRQLSKQLQLDFYRHYNLLHRLNIQKRIDCMKAATQNQTSYEECIDAAKNKMEEHVSTLQTRLAEINAQDEKCIRKCNTSNNKLECEERCVRDF